MKTVLITGAGRGLGRAVVNAYHKHNFMVIATDVDYELLADLEGKERFVVMKMDVTSEQAVEECAIKAEKLFGKLDVLVSNAGMVDFYPVSEAGADRLKKIFDVNFFGLANLVKYFLTSLVRSSGRLIVVSSESYKIPTPLQPYAVSKQALESLFKSIRQELMVKNVKSILIRPGAIQTHIMKQTLEFENPIENSIFQEEFENFRKTVPKYIGKISAPEDVAKVILLAGTQKRPKSAYHINHNPLVQLLAILPARLKDIAIKRSLKKKTDRK